MNIKEFEKAIASFLKRMQQRSTVERTTFLIGVLASLFSLLTFSAPEFPDYFREYFNFDLKSTIIPIFTVALATISFSILYLQSGGKRITKDDNSNSDQHILNEIERLKQEFHSSSQNIDTLLEKIDLIESEKGIGAKEKKQIASSIIQQVSLESIKDIFNKEAEDLKERISLNYDNEDIYRSTQDLVLRLNRVIVDQRLRANFNLIIGMIITGLGLYLLWTTVSMVDHSEVLKQLALDTQNSNMIFLRNLTLPLVPRISLVIFIEIFAYFFLKLYKEGLSDTKYFQNELTNVESKIIAIKYASKTNNEALKDAIQALSNTERNFVLEKGQSTVELQKSQTENELAQTIIKAIPEVLGKK